MGFRSTRRASARLFYIWRDGIVRRSGACRGRPPGGRAAGRRARASIPLPSTAPAYRSARRCFDGRPATAVAEHDAVVAAIAARDADGAEQIDRAHIREALRARLKLMQGTG